MSFFSKAKDVLTNVTAAEGVLPDPVFPDIGEPDKPAENAADPKALAISVAAMQEQITKLTAQGTASTEALAQANRLLEQTMASGHTPITIPTVDPINGKDWPDPVEDKDGHNAAIADAINRQNAQTAARTEAQARQTAQYDDLWERFTSQHPELAQHRDIAQVIGSEMLIEGAKRGITPEATAFTNQDGFIRDVATRLEARLEGIRADVKRNEGEGEGEAPVPVADRSGGMIGGSAPAPSGGKDGPKVTNLVEEMQEQQRTGGFM